MLRNNMDSHSWCSLPSVDHASRPRSTVFTSQVLQRRSSAGLGCCRVRRSPGYNLQHILRRKSHLNFLFVYTISGSMSPIFTYFLDALRNKAIPWISTAVRCWMGLSQGVEERYATIAAQKSQAWHNHLSARDSLRGWGVHVLLK